MQATRHPLSWGLRRSPSDFADFGAGILSPRNKKPGSRGARAEYVNLSGYSAEYRRKRRKNQAEKLSLSVAKEMSGSCSSRSNVPPTGPEKFPREYSKRNFSLARISGGVADRTHDDAGFDLQRQTKAGGGECDNGPVFPRRAYVWRGLM